MKHLDVRLFGPFQVTLDGEPITNFRSDKVRALLAYLCTETAGPHRREKLAGLLWPDWPETSARANLRRALANLRSVISDHSATPNYLSVTPQTIEFNTTSDAWVDIAAFSNLAACEYPKLAIDPSNLEQAVSLYRGEFLEGFSLSDSSLFEEWYLFNRERFHRLVLEAYQRLVLHYRQTGEYERGLRHAWKQVELDSWREEAHRGLVLLLAATGQRSAALTQYETCRQILAEELGTEPSSSLQKIYEILLKGETLPDFLITPPEEGRKPRQVGPCPYLGLAAFREQDEPFFFGREDFTERLVEVVNRQPMVAVIVGSSGCGKSSTVFAGLLPKLRASGDWIIADFRPGANPFLALASALAPLLSPDLDDTDRLIETRKLGGALSRGELLIADIVTMILENQYVARNLLLVVDQFEELYTLCPELALRRRFVDGLLHAVASAVKRRKPRFIFLLTMRADFMGQALAHRPFADALQEATVMLGPMNRAELRTAIEEPSRVQGAAFEAGLVERILDDVGEEPGNLPLLEFALTLLWERHNNGWLTHEGYENIGRVEGALARYADEVYAQQEEDKREKTRKIFIQLVNPGEGTEDTRRLATMSEVGEENWDIVQHLADRRLVVTSRDDTGVETVEVVHEALIRSWGHLQLWMVEDRGFRIWQERLRIAIHQWERTDRDEGALLRGAPLAEAEGWLNERREELSEYERAFIQAGITLQEQRSVEREAQRQRELETARKLAESESQRAEEQAQATGRLRQRAFLLAGASILAAFLAIIAFFAFRQAKQNANLATARELAAAAVNSLDEDPERSALLALEALNAAETLEGINALHRSLPELRVIRTLKVPATIHSLTISPDGKLLAGSLFGDPGGVMVWDINSGEELLTLTHPPAGVARVAFSLDGSLLFESTETELYRWEISVTDTGIISATSPFSITGYMAKASGWYELGVNWMSFSPDGKRLAVAHWKGMPTVFDLATMTELLRLEGHTFNCRDVAYSPDGTLLATASDDNTVRIWDADSGQELQILSGLSAPIRGVDFSPNGTKLAGVEEGGLMIIWDPLSGKKLLSVTSDVGGFFQVFFAPDGLSIFTPMADGTVRQWDATTGDMLLTFAGHTGSVLHAAVTPDGSQLASAGSDGTVKMWTTGPVGELHAFSLGPGVSPLGRISISPDGMQVAIGNLAGPASIWNPSTGELLFSLPEIDEGVGTWSVAYSPDGTQLAVGAGNGPVHIWDLENREIFRSLSNHKAPVIDLTFSSDGKYLATAGFDGLGAVWDLKSGHAMSLTLEEPTLFSIAFSPDDQRVATVSPMEEKTAEERGIYEWNVETGEMLRMLPVDTLALYKVVYSSDGKLLAAGTQEGDVLVWDSSSGELTWTLTGHTGLVPGLGFSPDGKRLASASKDNTVKVWDMTSGEELVTLYGQTGTLMDMVFSPDGNHIITTAGDGTVRTFVLDNKELVSLAQSRVTRLLTADECQKYLHLDECPNRP